MAENPFALEYLDTPIGRMMIVTDSEARLRAVDWQDYEQRMHRLLQRQYGAQGYRLAAAATSATKAKQALQAYFEGDIGAVGRLAVMTNGTAFQRGVWAALRHIPSGSTTSYGELAIRLGNAKATRAVGLANGANPIAIAVLCHRVIGANGALTGFGGGVERKHWLLRHEGALLA